MDYNRNSMTNLICNHYEHTGIREDDFTHLPRPYYTFAYVSEGKLECISSDRTVTAQKGDVVFYPYHLQYKLRWIGSPTCGTYSCHFLLPPMGDPFAGKDIPLQRLNGKGLKEEFVFIFENGRKKDQLFRVPARFYDLCDRLYRQMEYTPAPPMDERIHRATEYLQAHWEENISMEALAARCHMSSSRFYHLFKQETGFTPVEYKKRAAIRRGVTLMIGNPHISVEELSLVTGFASSAYFRRVFKEVTGKSPRDYRKMLEKNEVF